MLTIERTVPSKPVKILEIKHKMINIQVMGKVRQKRIRNHPNKKHCTVKLYDESGEITLHLWRDQTEQVNDGDEIYLIGAFTKFEERVTTLSSWEEKIHKEKPKIFGS